MCMADTDTTETITAAKALAKQGVGVKSVTVDGQTTVLADGLETLNAWERRRNRRNGANPTLCRIKLDGF